MLGPQDSLPPPHRNEPQPVSEHGCHILSSAAFSMRYAYIIDGIIQNL